MLQLEWLEWEGFFLGVKKRMTSVHLRRSSDTDVITDVITRRTVHVNRHRKKIPMIFGSS